MKPQRLPLTSTQVTAFRETIRAPAVLLLVQNWFLSLWVQMAGAEQGRKEVCSPGGSALIKEVTRNSVKVLSKGFSFEVFPWCEKKKQDQFSLLLCSHLLHPVHSALGHPSLGILTGQLAALWEPHRLRRKRGRRTVGENREVVLGKNQDVALESPACSVVLGTPLSVTSRHAGWDGCLRDSLESLLTIRNGARSGKAKTSPCKTDPSKCPAVQPPPALV